MDNKDIEKANTGESKPSWMDGLRIGNQVISSGSPVKVLGIRSDFGTELPFLLCDDTDVWYKGSVEPIPISVPILKGNGFGMSDDLSYGILRTTFTPFGDGTTLEFEDYVIVDLAIPQNCLVKHQYLVEHEGYKPSLHCRTYEGEIRYVHELQNLLDELGCSCRIKVTEEMMKQ